MKTLASAIVAGAVILLPYSAFAENEFATVETTLAQPETPTATSLVMTAAMEPADGTYTLKGITVALWTGQSTPIEVRVPAGITLDMAFATASAAGIHIEERFRSKTETPSGSLTKAIYSVTGAHIGSIVATDDLFPSSLYLLVAGVATIVSTDVAGTALCADEQKRVIDIRPAELFLSIESTCMPQ
jgi:hypothetical protein